MKLDRNITQPPRGKYALIKLRPATFAPIILGPEDRNGVAYNLVKADAIDLGETEDTEFFVIRLKDKYAAAALDAYAAEAQYDDPEYAIEILALADKAALHPKRRMPD